MTHKQHTLMFTIIRAYQFTNYNCGWCNFKILSKH